jgi:hypothetical protein
MGVEGSVGGGPCSRSITDFATSAADLMVSGDLRARGFGGGREAGRAGFAADERLRTLGLATAGLATTGLAGLVTAGLVTAAGFVTWPGAGTAAAASTFLRACLAAFFSILNASVVPWPIEPVPWRRPPGPQPWQPLLLTCSSLLDRLS